MNTEEINTQNFSVNIGVILILKFMICLNILRVYWNYMTSISMMRSSMFDLFHLLFDLINCISESLMFSFYNYRNYKNFRSLTLIEKELQIHMKDKLKKMIRKFLNSTQSLVGKQNNFNVIEYCFTLYTSSYMHCCIECSY